MHMRTQEFKVKLERGIYCCGSVYQEIRQLRKAARPAYIATQPLVKLRSLLVVWEFGQLGEICLIRNSQDSVCLN